VSFQFRQQLEGLLRTLQGTQPHYVMCYKPNTSRQPNALDRVLLRDQLHYSGALEVVRIRQKG
jgi:myosin heavy subunit